MTAVSQGCLAVAYRRRRPEHTTLYQVVQLHLETYLALAGEDDWGRQRVPAFVEREFRRYPEGEWLCIARVLPRLARRLGASASAAGRRRMKRVPTPTVLSTSSLPPSDETMFFEMYSPKPVPTPRSLVVKKASNT